jgi:hypothetical protein
MVQRHGATIGSLSNEKEPQMKKSLQDVRE